jgi:hypothetical protein
MALCRRALKPGKMKGSSETRDLAQTALVGMYMRVLYSIGTGSRLRRRATAHRSQLKGLGLYAEDLSRRDSGKVAQYPATAGLG